MKLGYRKSGLLLVPQYQKKDGTWNGFKKDMLANELWDLAEAIASSGSQRKVSFTFSDTEQIFFRNEMFLMAFLAGVKSFYEDWTREFEIFDEQIKKV